MFGSLASIRTCSGASRFERIVFGPPRRDDQRDRRLAGIEPGRGCAVVRQIAHQVKVGRGIESACEIPGEIGAVVIDDDDLHIVHVERERIAEEQDEQQRQRKGHVQAPVVPDDVVELLPGHGLYVSKIHDHCCPSGLLVPSSSAVPSSKVTGVRLQVTGRGHR